MSLWRRTMAGFLDSMPHRRRSELGRFEELGRHAAEVLTARFDRIEDRLARLDQRDIDAAGGVTELAAKIAELAAKIAELAAKIADLRAATDELRGAASPEIIRKLDRLEFLSRGGPATYVGSNRVLTKCVIRDAILAYLVEADDLLLAPWLVVSGCHEDDLVNVFLDLLKPDSRCLDIGANYGFFTCLFAKFAPQGKVIGIEPCRPAYELLRDNILINDLQHRASPMNVAAAEARKTMTLHWLKNRSGNTSLTAPPERTVLETWGVSRTEAFEVEALRVDDLLPEFGGRVDLMKIDVEGAEPLVLRGARETIAANPQIHIVMEWSPGQISGAGFEVAGLIEEIRGAGLKPAAIGPKGARELPIEALATLDYHAGILLRRASA